MDDYKLYAAPEWWRDNKDKVWGTIFIGCILAASFIPNNAERQAGRVLPTAASNEAHAAGLAVSAPYTPCQKLRSGKWLKYEIAQTHGNGWMITCVYDGDQLMTRDEARL